MAAALYLFVSHKTQSAWRLSGMYYIRLLHKLGRRPSRFSIALLLASLCVCTHTKKKREEFIRGKKKTYCRYILVGCRDAACIYSCDGWIYDSKHGNTMHRNRLKQKEKINLKFPRNLERRREEKKSNQFIHISLFINQRLMWGCIRCFHTLMSIVIDCQYNIHNHHSMIEHISSSFYMK